MVKLIYAKWILDIDWKKAELLNIVDSLDCDSTNLALQYNNSLGTIAGTVYHFTKGRASIFFMYKKYQFVLKVNFNCSGSLTFKAKKPPTFFVIRLWNTLVVVYELR